MTCDGLPLAPTVGGRIQRVVDGGVGAHAGLRAGDSLLEINGRPVRDVIDVQFLAADAELELVYARGEDIMRRRVGRDPGDEFGIEFETPLFDGMRECDNHCPFCFVRQLPDGLRRTLYVQDDDYRLSFLHGSFVTLTNLTDEDWRRLEEQRLSPLYVSVHATAPAVRERLLGRRGSEPIMGQLHRLIDLGITVHTQVVVLPGFNDGDVLEQTVEELAGLHPGVESIGLVPVGLTQFCRARLRRNSVAEADRLLARADQWHGAYREQHGIGLVYASDEWYLLAGRDIPEDGYYADYPQFENGIGLARRLLDDWNEVRRLIKPMEWRGAPVRCVSGALIGPLLGRLLAEFSEQSGIPVELTVVENRFFGETVTVSGLLPAGDVVDALKREPAPLDRLFLPRGMFDDAGQVTLDDWTLGDFEDALGCRPVAVECLSDLARPLHVV